MGGKIDQAKGMAKEAAGKASGDHELKGEGKTDQVKGDLKEGAEKAKDAIHDATR